MPTVLRVDPHHIQRQPVPHHNVQRRREGRPRPVQAVSQGVRAAGGNVAQPQLPGQGLVLRAQGAELDEAVEGLLKGGWKE